MGGSREKNYKKINSAGQQGIRPAPDKKSTLGIRMRAVHLYARCQHRRGRDCSSDSHAAPILGNGH